MKSWNGSLKLSKKQERNGDDPSAGMDDQNVFDCGNRLRDFLVIAALLCGDTSSGVGGRVLHNYPSPVVQRAHSFLVAFQPSFSDHESGDATRATLFWSDRIGGLFCVTCSIGFSGNRFAPLAGSDLAGGLPCIGCNSGRWQPKTRVDLTCIDALSRPPMDACFL
jgi:hypothetical protein